MDEKLKATIEKIKILSEQNKDFAKEMRKMFGSNTSSALSTSITQQISDDVSVIREALEIRANKSISYDFVREQRLRDQLIIDNLRMENAALDLQHSEEERFYTFCINAFYQLENIINYYFHITYPDIKELVSVIEKYTEQNKNEKGDFSYKKTGKEKSVGDIEIGHKINAICNVLFPKDKINMTLNQLRKVRNEGEHRCMIIQQEKNENEKLYNFFKYNSFNTIRILLKKIVAAIKENIGKPIHQNIELVEATICSILPSSCFVEYYGKIPDNLFKYVKDKQKGDKIKLSIVDGKIIKIIEN